jgi:hypothetical protein
MASGSFAHPNVVLYLLLCRGTQIEVDPRICSSRSHGDGGHLFTGCRKAQFIDPSRQRSRVMALRVRAADDQRGLSPSLLKADFGVFERAPIRPHDVPLDRRSLRRERRREKERTHEEKSGNKAVLKHRVNTAPVSKTRKCRLRHPGQLVETERVANCITGTRMREEWNWAYKYTRADRETNHGGSTRH